MNGLRAQWDENSIARLKERFNNIVKDFQKDGKINLDLSNFNKEIENIKTQLDLIGKHQIDLKINSSPLEGKMKQTVKNIDEAIKQFENLGKTTATNIKYDENGNLSSFIIELERAKGLLEKIQYSSAETESARVGQGTPLSYKGTGVTVTDNTSKVIEKEMQDMDKLKQKVIEDQESISTKVRQYQGSMTLNVQKLKNTYQDSVPTQQLQEFESKLQQLNATDMTNLRTQIKDLDNEFKALNIDSKSTSVNNQSQQKETNRVNNLGSLQGNFDSQLLTKSNAEIKSYMQNVLGANTQITSLKKSTDGLGNSTVTLTTNTKNANNEIKQEKIVLDQATSGIYKQSEALKEAGSETNGFSTRIKQAFEAVTSFGLITGTVYGSISKLKEAVTLVNQLNKSQSTIQFITGMSKTQVGDLTNEYSKLASQLHETTSGVMQASEEFLRAGNDAKNTSSLIQSSTVMAKLAGISQQESAQSILSIMNAYHMQADEMMSVVDKLTTVDNNSATSTAELSAAIQKVAATAQNSGVSLTELISYISTISSVTRQSADTIGTALNSVLSRYNAVKAGVSQDEEGETVNAVEKSLKGMGIAIRSSAGQFKDFNTVLDEISNKWKTFDQVQQNEIVTVLGGTRQRNYLLTLLNNMNMALDTQKIQTESAGNAMKSYGIYSESTEAKLNDLKNAQEQLWMSLVHSDTINGAIGLLTDLVKGIGSVTSTLGTLPTIIGVVSFAFLTLNKSFSVETIQRYVGAVMSLPSAYSEAKAEGLGLSATLEALGVGFDIAKLKAIAFQATVSLGLSLAITAVVAGITKLISSQKSLAEQLDSLKNEANNVNTGDSLIKKYEGLESQLKTLDKSSQDYKSTQDQILQVQQQLAKQFPNLVDGYDKENNALVRNIDNLKKYSEEQKKQILAKAGDIYQKKYNELQEKQSDFGFGSYIKSSYDTDINKYNKLVEARDAATAKGNTGVASDYAKEIDEITKKFKDFNDASIQLYEVGKKDVMYFDEASGKLIKYSDYLDKNTKEKQSNADASKKMNNGNKETKDTADDANNSIGNFTKAESDFAKTLSDAKDIVSQVNKVLDEHQKSGEFNLDTIYALANKGYPQLLAAMGNDKEMEQQLIKIKNDQVNATSTSLNNQLKMQADYVNKLVDVYNFDIGSFKSAEEAKNAIAAEGVKVRSALYRQEAQEAMANAAKSGDQEMIDQMQMDAQAWNGMADSMDTQINTAINGYFELKKMASGGIGSLPNAGSVNDDGRKNSGSKAADDAAKKAEQAQQDAYEAISDIEKKLQDQIKKEVEDEKKALDTRLKNYQDFIQDKMKALDDEYTQEDRKRKLDEENKKKAELQAQQQELMEDTSDEAKARRYDLQKQIDAQQEVISGLNRDNEREDRKANLQKQQDDYEKMIQAQKDALDAKYSDAEVAKMASSGLRGALITVGDQTKTAKDMLLDAMAASGDAFTAAGQKLQTELIDKLQKVQQLLSHMNPDGTISGGVALNILGSHKDGGIIQKQGLYELHQDEWVINRKQGNILDDLVKGNISAVQQYRLPSVISPQTSSVLNNNAPVSVHFDSLIGTIQGNIGQPEMAQIERLAKTELPKIVNDAHVNNLKRLGVYNPSVR